MNDSTLTGIERQLVVQYLIDGNVPVTITPLDSVSDNVDADVRPLNSQIFPVAIKGENLTVKKNGTIILENPGASVKNFLNKEVKVEFYFNRVGLYFNSKVTAKKDVYSVSIPDVIYRIADVVEERNYDFCGLFYYECRTGKDLNLLCLPWENVELFTSLYGIKGAELKKRIDESLEYVGLIEKRNDYAKTFSGGMKRRLNIACAIGHHPELLIFDEPTVGIDPQSRNFILDKIKESNKNGATVIYTSHYMEEVEAICTRIAIMDNGKLIAIGTSEELKKMVVEDTESITLEEVFLTLTGKKLRDY